MNSAIDQNLIRYIADCMPRRASSKRTYNFFIANANRGASRAAGPSKAELMHREIDRGTGPRPRNTHSAARPGGHELQFNFKVTIFF